jgi:hypothetical protein
MGKQWWKLTTNHNSLLTRVLEAKYFPKQGFVEAKPCHNPCFMWRSIWSSSPLPSLGYRWQIHTGSLIDAWSEPWIRTSVALCRTTSHLPHLLDLTVNNLFDPISTTWRNYLLQAISNEVDAEAILNILLHSCSVTNSLVWLVNIDGIYSVKSAYKLSV